nr:uncharacterized protein LOC129266104 [Lytechinus pictus]
MEPSAPQCGFAIVYSKFNNIKFDVSLPLLRKVDKILQRDIILKISHYSLILEVLHTCNQGSKKFHSERGARLKKPPTRSRSKLHLPMKANEGFSSLTDYQTGTQNLTFKIRDHFSEVIGKVTEYLGQSDDQSKPEIWASYEALFFSSTIPDIEKFYVLAYDGEAKLLQMLLPTADPRNMKLRGEWVIDILDPAKTSTPGTAEKGTQTDPTSSDEDDSGVSGKDWTSIPRHGFDRQNFYGEIKSGKDLDTDWSKHDQDERGNHVSKRGTDADTLVEHQLECVGSASHASLASNLVEEMENLYPFLRDVTLGSVGLSNLPAITPKPHIDQPVQKSRAKSGKGRPSTSSKPQKNHNNIVSQGPISFEDMFSRAYGCLRMALQERFPLVKLRWLVMCLQALSDSVKEQVSSKLSGENRSIGTDDLLPSLIFFLIKGDPGQVTALYPQLKFLEDYLPDIVASGIIGFTVAQFSTAFAFIIQTDDGES